MSSIQRPASTTICIQEEGNVRRWPTSSVDPVIPLRLPLPASTTGVEPFIVKRCHRAFTSSPFSSRTPSFAPYAPFTRRNDIHIGVGLLDLANAADIGANVFNATPPSTPAIIVMVIGATLGLVILPFSFVDGRRSWRNVSILTRERKSLKPVALKELKERDVGDEERAAEDGSDLPNESLQGDDVHVHYEKQLGRRRRLSSAKATAVFLEINSRELGAEVIDRLVMDVMLGFGALMVVLGTYLAIGGGNPHAFLASNLMTGYIGNVPAAVYGLCNAAWAVHRWRMFSHRRMPLLYENSRMRAGSDQHHHRQEAILLMKQFATNVKIHAAINGVFGLIDVAGSLMTASAYIHPLGQWGYVLLAPCIIAQIFTNRWWRYQVNYDRDVRSYPSTDPDELMRLAVEAKETVSLLSDLKDRMKRTRSSPSPMSSWRRRGTTAPPAGHEELVLMWLAEYEKVRLEAARRRLARLGQSMDEVPREKSTTADSPTVDATTEKAPVNVDRGDGSSAQSVSGVPHRFLTISGVAGNLKRIAPVVQSESSSTSLQDKLRLEIARREARATVFVDAATGCRSSCASASSPELTRLTLQGVIEALVHDGIVSSILHEFAARCCNYAPIRQIVAPPNVPASSVTPLNVSPRGDKDKVEGDAKKMVKGIRPVSDSVRSPRNDAAAAAAAALVEVDLCHLYEEAQSDEDLDSDPARRHLALQLALHLVIETMTTVGLDKAKGRQRMLLELLNAVWLVPPERT